MCLFSNLQFVYIIEYVGGFIMHSTIIASLGRSLLDHGDDNFEMFLDFVYNIFDCFCFGIHKGTLVLRSLYFAFYGLGIHMIVAS